MGEHVRHHHVLVVPFLCGERQIPERRPHLWPGDLYCSLPLHPHLQFLGGRVPLLRGQARPGADGCAFNDAYRYMDWLLTVPLLLIEILLVMKLDEETYNEKAKVLGIGSALMIVSGYYGELTVTGDLTPRWISWILSMSF